MNIFCSSLLILLLNFSAYQAFVIENPIENNAEQNKCGARSNNTGSRMLDDQRIYPGDHPWLVSLLQIVEGDQVSYFCGGSIIDKSWILTAAHCFYDSNSNLLKASSIVVTNTIDLKDANKTTYPVEKYILHPKYNNSTFDSDIALIKLKTDIKPMSSKQYPICLPEDILVPGVLVETAGWGYTRGEKAAQQKLKKAFLHTVSRRNCRRFLPTVTITRNMICAYGEDHESLCQGDNGGPLMKYVDDSYTVYGISSFTTGCGQLGKPGLYTNVYNFVEWIQDTMKNF